MSQKETFTVRRAMRLMLLTTREIHREIALTQSSSSRGAPTLASLLQSTKNETCNDKLLCTTDCCLGHRCRRQCEGLYIIHDAKAKLYQMTVD